MRWFGSILLGICALWILGFAFFLFALPRSAPAAPAADAIVVYTGIGGDRISAAMNLLNSGAAGRLLISGVNPQISRDEISKFWPGERDGFDCCVDLGHRAKSTEGNAIEVRDWASNQGYASLILVTSDYHMPRAVLETKDLMPAMTITPYPVDSGLLGSSGMPAEFSALRRLTVEYAKYLLVRAKTFVTPH